IFGRHFLQHLYRFLGSGLADSDPSQAVLLQRLGLAARPRLSHLWNADWRWGVVAPLVQQGEVSPWAALQPNYIAAMLAESRIDRLIAMRPDPQAAAGSTSVLQALLRHALLREIAEAAARLYAGETGADLAALLRDAELVDLVSGASPTLHWK